MKVNPKHLKFIELVAGGKSYVEAYKLIIPKDRLNKLNPRSAAVMGSKLGIRYQAEIIAKKKVHFEQVETVERINQVRVAFAKILTQAEVDQRMCEIILNGSDGMSIRAIDIYNRRFGTYAPDKLQTITDNTPRIPDLSGLSTEEIDALIKQYEHNPPGTKA